MRVSRVVTIPFLAAGVMFAAVPAAVDQAASLVEQRAAQMPKGQALEFRLLAAQSLQAGYPGLAHKFIDAVVQELRANPSEASASVKYTLAGLDPTDAATLFPPQPDVPKPAPGSRAQAGRKPVAAISEKMGTMRGLPTDADRAKVAIEATVAIRALPPDISKLSLSYSLANLVTEGDLGKEALNATASTLALALKENPATPASYYVGLARLVRYEHLAPLPADPVLDTATALLELHDQIVQEAGFSLVALDGKTYNLDALRGKVVLLNFWATWCPPCRREMPDMEKLYQRFASKGLVVLAVSDEKRETVEDFLKKQNYTFPVLLDPGRKVNTAFGMSGIPNSFLFDRHGKLVAQSIDMRTERQFLEMFKSAGLE